MSTRTPESAVEKAIAILALCLLSALFAYFLFETHDLMHRVMPLPRGAQWILDVATIATYLLMGVYAPIEAYRGNL